MFRGGQGLFKLGHENLCRVDDAGARLKISNRNLRGRTGADDNRVIAAAFFDKNIRSPRIAFGVVADMGGHAALGPKIKRHLGKIILAKPRDHMHFPACFGRRNRLVRPFATWPQHKT